MSRDINGDDMAFPCEIQTGESNGGGGMCTVTSKGLSKREWFAGMALQGMLANGCVVCEKTAEEAYQQADAMLEEGAK